MSVHRLSAYLCMRNAAEAIGFYCKAFGAREVLRLTEPSGRIGHAELDLGGASFMLADEFPELGFRAPDPAVGTSVTMHLDVDDADRVVAQAVSEGATIEVELKDEFYGMRSGCIRDPFGHRWTIGHKTETVSTNEMQRRYTEMLRPK